MMLRIFPVFLLALALSAPCYGGGIKESWYLMRGKSNMKIGNYKAAIEAYEKAVALNPKNREAQYNLGIAYEKQGYMDKAVSQYENYLKVFKDDFGLSFKLADILCWQRYQYRKKDAFKYYRQGLKYKEDPKYRHKLARLYAGSDETLKEAFREYKILLKTDKKNGKLWKEYALLWSRSPNDPKEAIKTFEKALNYYPNDFNLRLEYAKALSRDGGRHDEASVQFEKLLKQKRSLKVLTAYADHLAREKSDREKAIEVYGEVLKNNPSDNALRLKYAKLLGGKKSGSKKAMGEYKTVLRSQPANSEAHAGLARMYAWNDNPQLARHHANLAAKYNPGNSDIKSLKSDLNKGLEPEAYGKLETIYQPGDDYGLFGNRFTGNIRFDVNPYLQIEAEVGGEQFSNSREETGGMLLGSRGRYQKNKKEFYEGNILFHSAPKLGDGLEFGLSYNKEFKSSLVGVSVSRQIIYESYLSISGDTTYSMPGQGEERGAARENLLGGQFYFPWKTLEFGGGLHLGWVSSIQRPNNFTFKNYVFGKAPSLLEGNTYKAGLGYQFYMSHFASDNSGLSPSDAEPYGGGYFSPGIFLSHEITMVVSSQILGGEANLMTGPVFQFVNDASTMGEYGAGFLLKADYKKSFKGDYFIRTKGQFNQIATAYSRFSLTVEAGKTF